MKRRSYLAFAAIAGLSITAAAVAQTTPPARRAPPSPETMQRLQDGKIAMAVTALKMNESQLKLWGPVEAQIRANQAARAKARESMREARTANTPRAELPDRFERMGTMMGERAERMKSFAATFKPFYASLTDEQKNVVGPVMAELSGGKRGMRGRWAGWHGGSRQQ